MQQPLVSVKWLEEHFNDSKLIILDASIENTITKKETDFPGIQIKNARFFDLKNSFCDLENPLPNTLPKPEVFTEKCRKLGIYQDSIIVVYDNLGIYSSPRAWWMFQIMGFKNIAVLNGGLPAWMANNLRTEPIRVKTYSRGDFKVVHQKELVTPKENVLKNLNDKNALVFDARSKERFYALVPEPRENMRSGHIPNSINLPYTSVLKNGKFLSKIELKEILDQFDLKKQSLIFSCGSGITACIILLACELALENKKSLYDGSWAEWGQVNHLPISH